MIKIKGIAASDGTAVARVLVIKETEIEYVEKSNDKNRELKILDDAITKTVKQLEEIQKIAIKNISQDVADIFGAHLLLAQDPEILKQIREKINNNFTAGYSIYQISKIFFDMFNTMDDPYMKERAVDVKDVMTRLIKNALGIKILNLLAINEEVIIVAEDLTPSQTSQLNKKFVKGFATDIGGKTSHSAIMARTLEIPAIVGIGDITSKIKDGEKIILSGSTGEVIINPTSKNIEDAKKQILKENKEKIELLKLIDKKAITKDGYEFKLLGNIGAPEEAQLVLKYGGDGIGLFRSEFLYMGASFWPTEEEQFIAYKKVIDTLNGKKVTIRTLDIGGDKNLSYYQFPKELNPFLGYRAVRLCLDQPEVFKTQLKALLRAAKFGPLEVNVPMVATIDEVDKIKKIIEDSKKELRKDKKEFGEFELGIMVEIPSTADIADIFAKHVKFFSIGTNDLIQYTFAADRMSKKVSYLYQPYHPAILRKIKKVIEASNVEKIYTAICGEMAGDVFATPLLVGMGLHEFSMSPSSILSVKKIIRQLNKSECEKLVEKALVLETNDKVKQLILDYYKTKNIDL